MLTASIFSSRLKPCRIYIGRALFELFLIKQIFDFTPTFPMEAMPSTLEKTTESVSSGFVLKVSIVAALGGLLFGYDTAVIAGAIGFLQKKFELSSAMVGWAASSAIWGCVFGALFAGYLSDKI